MTDKTQENEGLFSLTVPVPMSFPNLLEPKAFTENGKEKGEAKYSANFNFAIDSEDLKAMKTLAAGLARAKWPDKPFFLTTQEGIKIPQILFPFSSGDKLADERKAKGKDGEWTRGMVVLTSRSKYAPRLSYIEKGRIVDLETDMAKAAAKGKFYNGVKALAQFNFLAYDAVGSNGKPGVTAYLNMVVSTGEGKRLGGGQSGSEVFKGYAGKASAEDPTAPGVGMGLDEIM